MNRLCKSCIANLEKFANNTVTVSRPILTVQEAMSASARCYKIERMKAGNGEALNILSTPVSHPVTKAVLYVDGTSEDYASF